MNYICNSVHYNTSNHHVNLYRKAYTITVVLICAKYILSRVRVSVTKNNMKVMFENRV